MDASHFDRVARLFADRRISRRAAMRQGGVGLAAAGLAAAGLSAAAAQDATPVPTGEKGEDDPAFLFVQSFQSGTLVPKEGSSDTFALTLEHGLGHTVYFSDRPERIVGAIVDGDVPHPVSVRGGQPAQRGAGRGDVSRGDRRGRRGTDRPRLRRGHAQGELRGKTSRRLPGVGDDLPGGAEGS